MKHLAKPLALWMALASTLCFASAIYADKDETDLLPFEAVPAEVLGRKIPKVDPNSDIEYLFYGLKVNDRRYGHARVRERHIKLKVYTENGVKDLDVIHLPYIKRWEKISGFKARITQPDGSFSEFDRSDLYERRLLKVDDFRGDALSFALPNLQVGSVVEYTWRSIVDYGQTWYIAEFLEEEWPSEETEIEFIPSASHSSIFQAFNYELEFEQTKDKTYLVSAENVPGIASEPYSPPARDYRGWLFMVYNREFSMLNAQAFWDGESEYLTELSRDLVKSKQRAVKKLADSLFEAGMAPEEKLWIAFKYCSNEITNIWAVQSGFTDEERSKLKDVDTPAETIKRGYGTGSDINQLFASLVAAAGFEVCYAYTTDAESMKFNSLALSRRLNFPERVVALRKNAKADWRYFDLSYVYLPFGWLDAANTGQVVLLPDAKKARFDTTEFLSADLSPVFRDARFDLNEYGDLSGSVQLEYNGYPGVQRKRFYDALSEGEREERFCARLKELFPQCEIRNFKMSGIFTRDKPLVVSYDIEIPGYGESVGDRVFFQPSFFEFGEEPMFMEEQRRTDIAFQYAWKEEDTVWFNFPEGFHPEEAASPGKPIDLGYFRFACAYALNKSQSKLRCKREFRMDNSGFQKDSYDMLKKILEDANTQDSHVMTISRKEFANAR
ncbi:DUF3857 domain-containing protein [Pelagicoccus enzymogenes]|uniref:DUF3857 domain-containing protein n=1 Tax=Pelagicoccus enzymogenes TaxID=2773457 RepID=UPI0028122089|nr:DUF3857 domain-containing protein [Pelagicoccus enzymogenes]